MSPVSTSSSHRPPTSNLVDYPAGPNQLGNLSRYRAFLAELRKVVQIDSTTYLRRPARSRSEHGNRRGPRERAGTATPSRQRGRRLPKSGSRFTTILLFVASATGTRRDGANAASCRRAALRAFTRGAGAPAPSADATIACSLRAHRQAVPAGGARHSPSHSSSTAPRMPPPPFHPDAPAERRTRRGLDTFRREEKATCPLMTQDN